MTSSPQSSDLTKTASSGVGAVDHGDRFAHGGFYPRCQQAGESAHATTLKGADQRLVATAKKPARILLVDAALALHESHLLLLRSIPAVVKTLASCADMYLHDEDDYALVILVLNSELRVAAEVAHFVRHRWVAARILLLEDSYTTIDD
jgi:6-phosphogluconolactonase (cycloisomerase 2 family)